MTDEDINWQRVIAHTIAGLLGVFTIFVVIYVMTLIG